MRTIIYVCDENRYSFRKRLAGIHRFAGTHNAHARVMNIARLGLSVEEALAVMPPKGMLIEQSVIERFNVPQETLRLVPTVICDITEEEIAAGFTGIRNDSDAEARKAIDALLALEISDYAYVSHITKAYWAEARERVFREMMTAAGKRISVFRPYEFTGERVPALHKLMGDWLSRLPKPCGILAANDEVGEAVIDVANQRRIAIPESIALIGIDNDELICNNTVPTLASVVQDFERSGYIATEMLLKMVRKPELVPEPRTYTTGEVIKRRSIRPFKMCDAEIISAVEYIHKHASDGIGVRDVVAHVGAGIRSTQQRFLKLTGHTIFDEIENVRFDRACSLLRRATKKINLVHLECGYGTDRALRDVFQKRTGLSPLEWRMKHA